MASIFPAAYRELIDAVPLPAVLVDRGGVVQMVNKAWREWSRRCDEPVEERIGRPVADLALTPEEEERLTELVAGVTRVEGTPAVQEIAPCLLWKRTERDSGKPIFAEVRAEALRDDEGKVRGGLLLWQDVTECRRLREVLQRTLRLEAVGRVTGNAAHEINNALSLVTGYAELALGNELDERLRNNLEAILNGGRQAGRVAEHLRFFSRRIRAGRKSLDINTLVSDLLALLRRSFERESVMLIEDLEPQVPEVEAWVGQIQLVVLSLVQNGLEAIVRSGEGGIVQVRTEGREGRLVLEVEDDGPGLSSAAQERVFDDFFTTKEGDEIAGLGLGLCRDIARAHGGELLLASIDEGTCVTLELPAKEGA